LPYTWNGTSYNTAGTYTFTTSNAAGCDSIATLVLSVSNASTSTTNITRCSNQLPYTWNGTNYNAAGTYTFTTTNAAGCDSVAALVLSISNVSTSTTTVTRCSNQLPYTWNGTNYNASGTYTFTTNNAAGCDSVATLVLSISNVSTSTTSITRCSNQLPYTWNGSSYNAAGTYTFTTVNAAGCDSIATLVLTVSNTTTSTTSVIRCSNQLPYNWNGTNYNTAGTYTFNTTNAAGCDSVAKLVLIISNASVSTTNVTRCSDELPYIWNGKSLNAPGTYTFTTNNVAGCDSVATLVFNVVQATPGIRYPTVTADPNKPVQLTARNLGNNYTYEWKPQEGLNSYSVINPVFNNTRTVEYTIRLTPNNGCSLTDTLLVKVQAPLPPEEIYVPKAWSPNNDGHNDKLFPLTQNIRELKYFRIFNRWGQLVFETNAIGIGWDGIFNGKPQVIDVYTWTAEAVGISGKVIKRAGNSVLLR
jgi:gliding motility-associated-like protein